MKVSLLCAVHLIARIVLDGYDATDNLVQTDSFTQLHHVPPHESG